MAAEWGEATVVEGKEARNQCQDRVVSGADLRGRLAKANDSNPFGVLPTLIAITRADS